VGSKGGRALERGVTHSLRYPGSKSRAWKGLVGDVMWSLPVERGYSLHYEYHQLHQIPAEKKDEGDIPRKIHR
jgi:hypothetical protein